MPEKIRVSVGSAIVLGLINGTLDAEPTTVYLLTYRPEKCAANCGFCPQARSSEGRADMLSRVTWPIFLTEQVVSSISSAVKTGSTRRVCIQTLNYPACIDDALSIIKKIRSLVDVPISISCQPLDQQQMERLCEAGVNRVSIPLDAATKEIFNRVKGRLAGGPYTWNTQRKALKTAVQVLGRGRVSTHLIAGLGEREQEIVQMIQWCVDLGVYPGLFSFTPIPGTALGNHPKGSLQSYRRVQLAHYLITQRKTRFEDMKFSSEGLIADFGLSEDEIRIAIETGSPFMTSGCPSCNRPFYNERPGGAIYNYPRQPSSDEIAEIEKQILT
ncbi:MAG: radical SAM protein [Candidatus Bathyarchaeota archaeon]|nr:MAG: radical SAM protein [Candidatus Bathyarchaeota archaeon]